VGDDQACLVKVEDDKDNNKLSEAQPEKNLSLITLFKLKRKIKKYNPCYYVKYVDKKH